MPPKRPRPPLDPDSLRDLALHYVGKYATSRARLRDYLRRKLKERGWAGEAMADPDALVARFADLGYVDDAAFAKMRGAALGRRGYGERRVEESLRAAGIEETDRADAGAQARAARWDAADSFARRKRIGPYALTPCDRPQREKQIAAFLRAGHDMATARRWTDAARGEPPDREEG